MSKMGAMGIMGLKNRIIYNNWGIDWFIVFSHVTPGLLRNMGVAPGNHLSHQGVIVRLRNC